MKVSVFPILILASAAATAQTQVEWAAPGVADLAPTTLYRDKAALPSMNDERTPVQFSHALERTESLSRPQPGTTFSRQYWLEVDGTKLAHGVTIPTTASGALIRISPTATSRKAGGPALDVSLLAIESEAGAFDATTGTKALADADALAKAAPFPSDSIAFRLDPAVGAGSLKLSLGGANGQYVIHVFEPDSTAVASLGMDKVSYLGGETFAALIGFADMTASKGGVSGFVVSPKGVISDLTFAPEGIGWKATSTTTVDPGMWEIHAFVSGTTDAGQPVIRHLRAPAPVAAPTARFGGGATGDAASFSLAVEVGTAGRFAARGVVYGTDAAGDLVPAAMTESAAWLEPGARTLDLSVDGAALNGLSAPFELRHAQLLDQTRMGIVQYQDVAARFFIEEDDR